MRLVRVAVSGVELAVRDWGEADLRPLVFWPGLNPWGALQLAELAPQLVEEGFRVLSIAAPVGGDSPALPDAGGYRPRALAELVLAVAHRLALTRFLFLGASWGAAIGVHLAAAAPERLSGLVLVDGGYADAEFPAGSLEELEARFVADQARFVFSDWSSYVEWAAEAVVDWRPTLRERYLAGMEEAAGAIRSRTDARAAARAAFGMACEPATDRLVELADAVPVLLLATADADGDALARFRVAVPQAEIVLVDCGHDILEARPAEVHRAVMSWVLRASNADPTGRGSRPLAPPSRTPTAVEELEERR
jgi:pimeloyl-ACP methyl ester carboxylesterase